jgi:hypothetical protein
MNSDERIYEAIRRIERHEAMCEERSKTIFNRLSAIEDGLESINNTLLKGAGVLICGMAGLVVSLLFLLQ